MSTAMTQRIQPIEPPYTPEVQAAFDIVMRGSPPLNLFRTVANNPRVLQRMMAGGLLDRGSISLRQRELMILRTCARCGAEYEWAVHVASFGAKVAWTDEQLHTSVHGTYRDACWTSDEALVIRLADALHDAGDVDDELWQALRQRYDSPQCIELIMLAGLYHAVSFMVRACRIEGEPGMRAFP